jgi:hypothetical protein
MIVLDASAAVDWLLQTSAGKHIEKRIYSNSETLHAPHLLDLEVTQVLRRLVLQGVISPHRAAARRSAICWISVLLDIPIRCSCPASGNSVTIFLPMMLPTSCLPRNSEPYWLRGMLDSLLVQVMRHPSSSIDLADRQV